MTFIPPSDLITDAPQLCLSFNPAWRPYLLGLLDLGANEGYWDSDQFEGTQGILGFIAALCDASEEDCPVPDIFAIGTIVAHAADDMDSDYWLLCDGAAVSRSTYAALFALIGVTYGSGNGSTTFNLPDFRGRSPAGAGQLSYPGGGTGDTLVIATKYGSQYNALTSSNLPPHSHTVQAQTAGGVSAANTFTRGTHLAAAVSTSVVGSGDNFVIQSPVLTVNFYIRWA